MYWKLYAQFVEMVSDKEGIMNQIRMKLVTVPGVELEKKVRREFFWLKVNTYTWLFILACFIKPLGQIFSRRVLLKGAYKVPFENISVKKTTWYKVFGVTIWRSRNQRLTEEDIEELIK